VFKDLELDVKTESPTVSVFSKKGKVVAGEGSREGPAGQM